jgi:hypothetical protein
MVPTGWNTMGSLCLSHLGIDDMDMTEARSQKPEARRRPCFLLGQECEAANTSTEITGNTRDRHGISLRTASPFREAMAITPPLNFEFAIAKTTISETCPCFFLLLWLMHWWNLAEILT